MIPVLVISLITATDRRQHMHASMQSLGVEFTFFDAVDGRVMTPAELAAFRPQPYHAQTGRQLTNTEIAVAASFRGVLSRIAQGPDELVAVLEDDALLSTDAKQFLSPTTLATLPAFDVLRLYNDIYVGTGGYYMSCGRIGDFEIAVPMKPGNGCVAQVFSREGARKIVDNIIPLRAPIDNLIYRDANIPCLKILEVRPGVAHFKVMPSTVGGKIGIHPTFMSRLRKRRSLLARNIRSVVRFVRCWGLLSLTKLKFVNRTDGLKKR
jgi:hypothetical protein